MDDYVPPEQFRSIILNTVEKLRRASDTRYDEQDGWEVSKEKNNVAMARKKSQKVKGERLIHTVRGKGVVRCDAETFRNMVIDLGVRRKQWDPVFHQGKVVELIDEKTTVVWMELKTKKCVVDFHRDLLYLQHSRKLTDGSFIVASRSAGVLQDDTLVPLPEGCIRATLHTSGYVIRPLNDELGNCEVTYVVQCDTGDMPSVVVNRLAEDQPQCIHRQRLAYADMFGGGSDRIVLIGLKKDEDVVLDDEEMPTTGNLYDDVQDQMTSSRPVAAAKSPAPSLRLGSSRADSSGAVSPRTRQTSSGPVQSVSPRVGSPRAQSAFAPRSPRQSDRDEDMSGPQVEAPPSPRTGEGEHDSQSPRPVPSPRGARAAPTTSPKSNPKQPPSPTGSPRSSPRALPRPPPRK